MNDKFVEFLCGALVVGSCAFIAAMLAVPVVLLLLLIKLLL